MAKYVMQEAVDLNKEGKTLTYPKLIIGQCVDSNALAKQIASHTTFSRGEIVAVIDYLWSYMAENLDGGRRGRPQKRHQLLRGEHQLPPGEKAHERCQ